MTPLRGMPDTQAVEIEAEEGGRVALVRPAEGDHLVLAVCSGAARVQVRLAPAAVEQLRAELAQGG